MKLYTIIMETILILGFGLCVAHAQKVRTVYSFTGADSSGNPVYVTPAQGRNGRLFGTTYGPSGKAGVVFEITTSGAETQLYTFGSDGSNPLGGVTLGYDGNFYGTTSLGGSSGNGVLFRLSSTGVYTVLHEFQGGDDGARPFAPPMQASDGNFYGTTFGTSGASTIYRYQTNGSFATISNLQTTQGTKIISPLIQGSDGNLYGTASGGGTGTGCGTLFKLSLQGKMLWTYSFPCGSGGANPEAPLVQGSDGNYYGTTFDGGSFFNYGTIFKLDQSGNVSILHTFDYLDGSNIFAGLTQGTDGALYGAAYSGGKASFGTLFRITTSGAFSVLYYFGVSGQNPYTAPIQDTNGLFYGTTYSGGRFGYGTVYSLDVGLGPFITFVQPTGKIGRSAQILGQKLTGTTAVTFNGVAATSFKVVSDTYMTAVVPDGATTGPVVVTTPTGKLTSNVNFRISK